MSAGIVLHVTTDRRLRTTRAVLVSSALLFTACSGDDAGNPGTTPTDPPASRTETECSALDSADLANDTITNVRAEPTGTNSCQWIGDVDGTAQTVASVNVLEGERSLGNPPLQIQSTPDPVKIDGAEVSWRESGLPSGVRLGAFAGGWTITVDVATGASAVDVELAEKAMRATIERLEIATNQGSDLNDGHVGSEGEDADARQESGLWTVPACNTEPAEGMTVTSGPVPGGCTFTTGSSTFNVAISQPEHGTREQVLAASITSTDATGATVEWEKRSVDVGDAASLLLDPTASGVNGMLVVLDGGRVMSISFNSPEDSAIDVAVDIARTSLAD